MEVDTAPPSALATADLQFTVNDRLRAIRATTPAGPELLVVYGAFGLVLIGFGMASAVTFRSTAIVLGWAFVAMALFVWILQRLAARKILTTGHSSGGQVAVRLTVGEQYLIVEQVAGVSYRWWVRWQSFAINRNHLLLYESSTVALPVPLDQVSDQFVAACVERLQTAGIVRRPDSRTRPGRVIMMLGALAAALCVLVLTESSDDTPFAGPAFTPVPVPAVPMPTVTAAPTVPAPSVTTPASHPSTPLAVSTDEAGRPYDVPAPSGHDWRPAEVTDLVVPTGELVISSGLIAAMAPKSIENGATRLDGLAVSTARFTILYDLVDGFATVMGARIDLSDSPVVEWTSFEPAYEVHLGWVAVASGSIADLASAAEGFEAMERELGEQALRIPVDDLMLRDLDGTPGDDLVIFVLDNARAVDLTRGLDAQGNLVSVVLWAHRFPWRLVVTDGIPPPEVTAREEAVIDCLAGSSAGVQDGCQPASD